VIAVALVAGVLAIAPLVSAGQNGGWGKGLLSNTLLFHVDSADEPAGYMYWSPDTPDFKYDFHGYYLDVGTVYYLICYAGEPLDEPDNPVDLGWCPACSEGGVHIKGEITWPELEDATICLVPESYMDGSEDWNSSEYQISEDTIDLNDAFG